MISTETGFSMFLGYFLAKVIEWAKNHTGITWLNPDNTYLIQFLTAACSFAWAFGVAYSNGAPLDPWANSLILWDALSTWVTAELTYHKTLKEKNTALVQVIQESPEAPSDWRGSVR